MVKCTPAMFEEIVEAVASGHPLLQLIDRKREIGDFPTYLTVMNYIRADNTRKSRFHAARESGADALADQVLIEADCLTTDPQRASNRMKARQWRAAKLQPRVYGDKLDIDVNHKIDVATAIAAARQRAKTIDNPPQSSFITSDTQSEDNVPVDPFS